MIAAGTGIRHPARRRSPMEYQKLVRKHGLSAALLYTARDDIGRTNPCEYKKFLNESQQANGSRWSPGRDIVADMDMYIKWWQEFNRWGEIHSRRGIILNPERGRQRLTRTNARGNGGRTRVYCVVCCRWHNKKHKTSWEHIPLKSLGGEERVRICAECNTKRTKTTDDYTRDSTVARQRDMQEILVRGFGTVQGDSHSVTGEHGGIERFEFGDTVASDWQRQLINRESAEEIRHDHHNMLRRERGACKKLGIQAIHELMVVRYDAPEHTSSTIKGAFLLLCQALGGMGKDYAVWAKATKDLFIGRHRFQGEPWTSGSDNDRIIPVVPYPEEFTHTPNADVGFYIPLRQWLVRVGNELVVLPAYDPYHTDWQTLVERSSSYEYMSGPGESRFQPLINEACRKQSEIVWLKRCKKAEWGAPNLVYGYTGRNENERLSKDAIGTILRVSDRQKDRRWKYVCVVHQNGRRFAGVLVDKNRFNAQCWRLARRNPGELAETDGRPHANLWPWHDSRRAEYEDTGFRRRSHYNDRIIRS